MASSPSAPRPGIVLEPKHKYAYVVMTSAQDVNGASLAVAPALAQALTAGSDSTDPVAQLYAVVPPALQAAGVDPTPGRGGDGVHDRRRRGRPLDLSTMVLQQYGEQVNITDLAVDPVTLDTNERFCELEGQVTYPQFQVGSPPYDTGGLFTYDSTGMPILQGQQVSPITITLPKSAMPAGGYPLIVYFHGTGGISREIADRGPWRVETDTTNCPPGDADAYRSSRRGTASTGCYTPGQGPGWVWRRSASRWRGAPCR